MTRNVARWTLAGALALAGVGAIGAAEAGASGSPFAGKYSTSPGSTYATSISISQRGDVHASYSFDQGTYAPGVTAHVTGSGSGTVTDAGTLSIDWKEKYRVLNTNYYSQYHVDAAVALDGAGNIVGTDSLGFTFKWIRL